MKLTSSKIGSSLWPAVLCGVLSVLIDFVLIPQVLHRLPPFLRSLLLPDPIWMSLMILLPVIVAIYILEQKTHILPGYVWIGLPVQYLILIVFAGPIREVSPFGFDDWTYIWEAMVWPLSVTAAQFVSLIALRFWKTKRSKQ